MTRRLGAAFIVCCLLSMVLIPADTAGYVALAQAAPEAVVAISKTVRGGNAFVPGQPFTYVLNYSCSSSVIQPCTDMVIEDQLPATLSRNAADVTLGGDLLPSAHYDEATGTATFDKGTFQPATGQITITVKFPVGTPVGTEAVNAATIRASNATTATSPPVRVTALAFSDLTVSKRRLGPAQLDTPVTYRVTATIAAGANQIIRNARLVDQLLDGVVFQSATGGGTYDPATNQVTWDLGDIVPGQPAPSRDLTVIFPSGPFNAGQVVVNTASCFGTPDGGTEVAYPPATDQATLRAEGPILRAQKTSTATQLGPGQVATYTLTGFAPADTDLTSLTITDQLPTGLVPLQGGGPNLTGTGPGPVVTVAGGGPIPVTAAGGGWSATVPASAPSFDVTFAGVPANESRVFQLKAGIPANGRGRDGNPVQSGHILHNCAVVSGAAPGTTVVTRTQCLDQTVVPIVVDFTKRLTTQQVVAPGGSATWVVALAVPSSSASPLVQPVISDCLPPGFDVADPTASTSATGFTSAPTVERAEGVCPDGRVQLRWSWPAPFAVAPGEGGSITVTSSVRTDALPGSFTNDSTLTAENLTPAQASASIVVSSTTLLVGSKSVRGDRDQTSVGAGSRGHTTAGGSLTYTATIRNVSGVAVTKLVLVDILPAPGDTGVRSAAARGSAWRPELTGIDSGATMSYSASLNPCRLEMGYEAPGCVNDWSSSPPGGQLANVRAFRADFGPFELGPQRAVTLTWTMRTPDDAAPRSVAWNSFAFVAQRADNGEQLVPSEPPEVGAVIDTDAKPSISIVKRVNGQIAEEPPGLFVPVGDPVVFTYEVTNTGNVPIEAIKVSDDVLGPIPCPADTLAPGESMTCTAPTQTARAGLQTNIGTVTAVAPIEDPSGVVTLLPITGDPSEANLVGFEKIEARVDLVKRINGQVKRVAPGLSVPEGDPISFTYTVTNIGAVRLADLRLVDDHLGGISCPRQALNPRESTTCTAPVQVAVAGGGVNVARVTADATDAAGTPTGPTVTATDLARYSNEIVEPTTIVVTGASSRALAALGGAVLGAGLGLTGVSKLRPRRRRRRSTRP